MSGLLATAEADVDALADATPIGTPSEEAWADESSVVSSNILDVPNSTIRSSSGQRSVLDSATTVSDAPSRNEKDRNISAAVSHEVEQTYTSRRSRGNHRINAGGRGRRDIFRSRDTLVSPMDVEKDVNQESEYTTPSVIDNKIFTTRIRRARNQLNQTQPRPPPKPKTPPLDPTLIEDEETSKIGLMHNIVFGPSGVPYHIPPLPREQTFTDPEPHRRTVGRPEYLLSDSSGDDLSRRSRPRPREVESEIEERERNSQYERPEGESIRRRRPDRGSPPTWNSQYLANSLQGARPEFGAGTAGISSTISKDNTHGDGARNAKLLAEFARKNRRTGLGRGFRGHHTEKAGAAGQPLVDNNSNDEIGIGVTGADKEDEEEQGGERVQCASQ